VRDPVAVAVVMIAMFSRIDARTLLRSAAPGAYQREQ